MKKTVLWTLIVAVPLLTMGCESKNPFKTGFYKTGKTTQQAAAAKQQDVTATAAATNTAKPLAVASQVQPTVTSGAASQNAQIAATTSEQQYKQGYDLFYGIGATHDEKHGIKLLEQAASQGHANAKQLLARLDEMGYEINDAVLHSTTQTAQAAPAAIPASSNDAIAANTVIAEQAEIVTEQDDWYYSEDKAKTANTTATTTANVAAQQTQQSAYDQIGSVAAVASQAPAKPALLQPTEQSTAATAIDKSINPNPVASTHEKALLSMDQSFYTLQLVAARDKEGVDKFVADNQLSENVHIVKKNTAGTDWYVAYYGNYPNQKVARAAAKQLPSSVKRNAKPWVRNLRTVQEEINQNAG